MMNTREKVIEETVQRLVLKYAGPSVNWKPGDVVRHPKGYDVRIDSGCYLSNGRLSNFWYWTVLRADGTPTERTAAGYGWDPSSNEDPNENDDL